LPPATSIRSHFPLKNPSHKNIYLFCTLFGAAPSAEF
jgi:hypothetical protein